mmetsp:Transcript_5487/g.9818  ORF Transcript_5487/g.9818 Transcript_5487/m.9818 type:complete len:151 (+) Transcript_5487:107-559(+)
MGRSFVLFLPFVVSEALVSFNRTDQIVVSLNSSKDSKEASDDHDSTAAEVLEASHTAAQRAARAERRAATLEVNRKVWPGMGPEDPPPPFRALHFYMAVSMLLAFLVIVGYRGLRGLFVSGPPRPLEAHDPLAYAFKARQLQKLRHPPSS